MRKERPKPPARGARRAGRSLGATGGAQERGENALCPEGRLCTRSFPAELRKGTHATSPSSHGNRRPLERWPRSAPGSANYAASSPRCADPRPHPRGLPRREAPPLTADAGAVLSAGTRAPPVLRWDVKSTR